MRKLRNVLEMNVIVYHLLVRFFKETDFLMCFCSQYFRGVTLYMSKKIYRKSVFELRKL